MYIVDDNLLRFLPNWFVAVDAGDERWIDIECWIDANASTGAALGEDQVYFVERADAERFAAEWRSHVEEWNPVIDEPPPAAGVYRSESHCRA